MGDVAGTTPWSRLGIQRIVKSILTVFAARGTPWRIFVVWNAARSLRPRRSRPSPGWDFHLSRCFWLRLGGPDLHRLPRHHQRLLVETAAGLVTLLGRVRVALAGGEREPFVGLRSVGFDADAPRIENAEIVLA